MTVDGEGRIEEKPLEKWVEAKVVTGDSHVLALRADNSVWAYGLNTYGQLGIGKVDGQDYLNGSVKGSDDPVEVLAYEHDENYQPTNAIVWTDKDGITRTGVACRCRL